MSATSPSARSRCFAPQFHCFGLVARSCNKEVTNLGFVFNRAPKPELPAHNGTATSRDADFYFGASGAMWSDAMEPFFIICFFM